MQQAALTPGGAAPLSHLRGPQSVKAGHHSQNQPLFPSIDSFFFSLHVLLFNQTRGTQIPRLQQQQQHLKINWHGGVLPWQRAPSLPVYTCIITIRLQQQDCGDERRREAFGRYRDVLNNIIGAAALFHGDGHIQG